MPTPDWMFRNTNEATESRARQEAEGARASLAHALGRLLVVDRDRLASVLAWHLLAGPECDHETKTDVAACACGQWRSEPMPSVGAAIDAWAQHVISVIDAVRRAALPPAADRDATRPPSGTTREGRHG